MNIIARQRLGIEIKFSSLRVGRYIAAPASSWRERSDYGEKTGTVGNNGIGDIDSFHLLAQDLAKTADPAHAEVPGVKPDMTNHPKNSIASCLTFQHNLKAESCSGADCLLATVFRAR